MLFACAQPVAGSQLSSVHTFPSSQLGAAPPTHLPPEQASPVVQALPSSQGFVLFACAQPVAGSQLSVVQRLLSSQLGAPEPVQTPPEQTSVVVQELLSSHALELFVKTQVPMRLPGVPLTSQLSVVHTLSSLQIFVAHGFKSVVTTRSVQSHFDPVPAC
jgi:hypothetical protein